MAEDPKWSERIHRAINRADDIFEADDNRTTRKVVARHGHVDFVDEHGVIWAVNNAHRIYKLHDENLRLIEENAELKEQIRKLQNEKGENR